MRLLLTNDDGIHAPGLKTLEHIAREMVGPDGEIYVVAPAREQSGVAHAISFTSPMAYEHIAPNRWAVDGTPADCVMAAVTEFLPAKPDVILSGVNKGNNAGENAVYSGTLGGAMEGALKGVKSIALSQFFGPKNKDLYDPFDSAAHYGAQVALQLITAAPWDLDTDYPLFYNVNFPPVSAPDTKGVSVTYQGMRPSQGVDVIAQNAPSGQSFLWAAMSAQAVEAGAGSDVSECASGSITVTPMRADLTAHERLDAVTQALSSLS